MRPLLLLFVVCASCAAVVISLQLAAANHACVTVSVSVPVAGKTTKGTCVPAPASEHTFYLDHCDRFDQVGVEVCETIDVHLP